MISLNPEINISLKIITIDEKNIIGFSGNDIIKIISDIITRSLSAIGSSIFPVILS